MRTRENRCREMSLAVGLISGTSMDGIDACLVRIAPPANHELNNDEHNLEITLVHFLTKPYPPAVREGLTQLCSGGTVWDVCRYNFLLGVLFAEAAQQVVSEAGHSMNDITVIGSHGQTVCHLPEPQLHGYSIPSTLQIAESAVIAARCGVTTVGDFRVADIALGGQGAPLVPYLDRIILSKHYQQTGKVGMLLNIGGISNITVLLPLSMELIGFDCGPGNVLIDALMKEWYRGVEFDKGGETALSGCVNETLLEQLMDESRGYVERDPPKSLGKEEFDEVSLWLKKHEIEFGLSREDIIATVTEFTAVMVAESYSRYIKPRLDQCTSARSAARGLYVSGGGAHNQAILRSLRERLEGVEVGTSASLGVDPDSKEAVCFALLAYQTVRGVATSVPSVTGASRPAVLGKICHSLTTPNTTSKSNL